jgi:hypothetical protein
MPKAAGSDLKAVQLAPSRPQPQARGINHQTRQEYGPHHNPPSAGGQAASNRLAAETVGRAKRPGGIDSRKQHY